MAAKVHRTLPLALSRGLSRHTTASTPSGACRAYRRRGSGQPHCAHSECTLYPRRTCCGRRMTQTEQLPTDRGRSRQAAWGVESGPRPCTLFRRLLSESHPEPRARPSVRLSFRADVVCSVCSSRSSSRRVICDRVTTKVICRRSGCCSRTGCEWTYLA